jgi:type I restriction enzyme S subunit
LIGGGTPKTEIEEYWNGSIPWISGKDITPNNRSIIIQTEKSISKMGLENSSAKLLPAFSTVISARGTVGNFCLLASEMTISQSNYALKSTLKNTDFFLFQQVANLVSEMQQKSYGTVFDTITTKTFSEIKIPIPPHSEMVRYDTTMKSIFEKRIETLQESRTLTALRDALLPWLMCGKLLSYFN